MTKECCPKCGSEFERFIADGQVKRFKCETLMGYRTHEGQGVERIIEGEDCIRRQLEQATAQNNKLLALLSDVDVIMDTAAMLGVRSILGDAYAEGWANVHQRVRQVVPNPTG